MQKIVDLKNQTHTWNGLTMVKLFATAAVLERRQEFEKAGHKYIEYANQLRLCKKLGLAAYTYTNAANCFEKADKISDCIASLHLAIDIWKSLYFDPNRFQYFTRFSKETDAQHAASCYYRIAVLEEKRGNTKACLEAYEGAGVWFRRAGKVYKEHKEECNMKAAKFALENGDFERAMKIYQLDENVKRPPKGHGNVPA